jgi:DNA primase
VQSERQPAWRNGGIRVASRSSLDDKERIRQAIDIVDLVGSYLQLRREGRGYKAICPWHDDRRPSLQVNPERQSFKCWVCDIGGDIFSFIMKMERVEFPEAMAMLAERAGITLTPQHGGEFAAASKTPGSPDDKKTLYEAAAWAEREFHQCLLKSPEAEPARRYLRERGITDESVLKFHLGFAPDRWDWLIQRALKTNFSPAVLERVGLLVRKDNGSHYDRFRGRVLFSIRDPQGRPVAVGGRVLPEFAESTPAKYINSPESPLFSKNKMLYALDVAREPIAKSRTAMVMEGYTDCIIAQQCGFANAVAVLGTALGEKHVRVLHGFADTIDLVLDGDEAGQRRTNEILSLFVAAEVEMRVVTLPDNLDPCDFLLGSGPEKFATHLGLAVDALEHAFRIKTLGLDVVKQPHEASKVLDDMLQIIAQAPALGPSTTSQMRTREWMICGRLAKMFRLDTENENTVVWARLSSLRGKQRPNRSNAVMDSTSPIEPLAPLNAWDREMLEILLLEPESVAAVAEVIRAEHLSSESGRRVFAKCRELAAAGDTPSFDRLLLEFDDPRYKNLLVDLDEQGRAKGTLDTAVRLRELLDGFRRRDNERQARAQTRTLQERGLDPEAELALLNRMIEQERSRQGISAPTDG